jgi:hypothetical protein
VVVAAVPWRHWAASLHPHVARDLRLRPLSLRQLYWQQPTLPLAPAPLMLEVPVLGPLHPLMVRWVQGPVVQAVVVPVEMRILVSSAPVDPTRSVRHLPTPPRTVGHKQR